MNVNVDSSQTSWLRHCIYSLTPPLQCPENGESVSRRQNSVLCSCECTISELSEFERGKAVVARMVDDSVTKVDGMFRVSRDTVSKMYSAYRKSGKTSPAKIQRERKSVLCDRDIHSLKRIGDEN